MYLGFLLILICLLVKTNIGSLRSRYLVRITATPRRISFLKRTLDKHSDSYLQVLSLGTTLLRLHLQRISTSNAYRCSRLFSRDLKLLALLKLVTRIIINSKASRQIEAILTRVRLDVSRPATSRGL